MLHHILCIDQVNDGHVIPDVEVHTNRAVSRGFWSGSACAGWIVKSLGWANGHENVCNDHRRLAQVVVCVLFATALLMYVLSCVSQNRMLYHMCGWNLSTAANVKDETPDPSIT